MEKLEYSRFVEMLGSAASAIAAAKYELTELDSQIGDGDHGTTMVKVMEKVRETAESYGGGDFKGML